MSTRRALGTIAALTAVVLAAGNIPHAYAASTLSMRGADVSTLQRAVDLGARYYTAAGVAADPLDILKTAGVNYVVVNNDFTNLSLLLKSGHNATKACNSATQVVIHTADADSDAHARWFYDGIKAKGVTWDITGLSYYCNWHGTMANLTSVVADMISRYGRPVIIAETAAPFTLSNADSTGNSISSACSGYAATWAGQGAAFTAVQNAAKAGGAIGVFYWEPTWTAVAGNGWDPANINGSGDGWDNMAVFNWTGVFNSAVKWIS